MTTQTGNGRPLRVLEVLEPSGGGSGRHFNDLCRALKEHHHSVTAVYSPLRAEDRFVKELRAIGLDGVHAVRMMRAPGPSDFAAWYSLNRIIKTEGPFDIIHAHSSKAGALTRIRLPGKHVPRVYTPHAFRTMDPTLGSKGRLLFGAIEGLFGKHLTDALICVSDDEYRHAAQDLKIPRNILHTVVNGCEPPPSGRRTEIRAQFHAADNDFIFGFVGRLSAQKAPERLIRAFASIAPALPQTRLAMIGFGEMQAQMEAEIDASGFADRIILTSAIAGPEAMQAFDCLVMPSRYEAMSYVMLEAAAAGLPLILTNVGGASTVLSDGENGYMVENSDDAMALSQAMTKVANPIIFRSLKERATARRDRYSLESMVAETERIYLQLSNSKSTQ